MGAWKRIFDRITVAAKKLTSWGHPAPRQWPNLAPPESIPADAADHAEQFTLTWYDRLCDAVIAHEYHRGQGVSHAEAERRAAQTELPVTDGARRILRAMVERGR